MLDFRSQQKVNDIKGLVEVDEFSSNINIETQMFKYFQTLPFTDKDRYLYKYAKKITMIL